MQNLLSGEYILKRIKSNNDNTSYGNNNTMYDIIVLEPSKLVSYIVKLS